MTAGIRAAFLVQRIGPYHHARLSAWAGARSGPTRVIEFRAGDTVYAWTPVDEGAEYERVQTRAEGEIARALDEFDPQVVVCVGYSDPEISRAMSWALRRKVPLVVCSDSTYDDEPRTAAREIVKRRLAAAFDAALVAGERAQDYLVSLGFKPQHLFRFWDVVDNLHFERGAAHARRHAAIERARLRLPARYFLCVARFVPKKNLLRLLRAFARYVAGAGSEAWSLVLSGSGPEEAGLRAQVATAGLEAHVHFPGFLQYGDLPACYGLAEALVLPSETDQWGLVVNEAMAAGLPALVSSRCGCTPDLIREGKNGFVLDPRDEQAMAARLGQFAAMPESARVDMGRQSQEVIAPFSPAAFGAGLEGAIACALSRKRRTPWLTRLCTHSLALRAAPAP
jgi:glycosyltransferase involved in cell wall biosynthesis